MPIETVLFSEIPLISPAIWTLVSDTTHQSRVPSTTIVTSIVTTYATDADVAVSPVVVTVTATSVEEGASDTNSIDTTPFVITVTTLDQTIPVTLQRSANALSLAASSTSSAADTAAVSGVDRDKPKENNTAKVALSVSIPIGIILIALLLAGAYLWGKRASQLSMTVTEDMPAQKEASKDVETQEPSPKVPQELPTDFNFAELFASEKPQEMAHQTPIESLDKEVAVDHAEGESAPPAQREVTEVSQR